MLVAAERLLQLRRGVEDCLGRREPILVHSVGQTVLTEGIVAGPKDLQSLQYSFSRLVSIAECERRVGPLKVVLGRLERESFCDLDRNSQPRGWTVGVPLLKL